MEDLDVIRRTALDIDRINEPFKGLGTSINTFTKIADPFRDVRKDMPNHGNALGIVRQTNWSIASKVTRTAFDLMYEKNKMLKNGVGFHNLVKAWENPNNFKLPAFGLEQNYKSPMGIAMTEFQRMNVLNKVMGTTSFEALRQQSRMNKFMTAELLQTDPMTAFRTSLSRIENPYVRAVGVKTHFHTVDTIVRNSILPLDGKQIKQVYEEVIEFVEETDYLREVLPGDDKSVANTLSTPALKNRCYQMVMGVVVFLMGTALTTEEIRTIIEQLLKVIETLTSVIDAVTILAPASERQARQNRQLNTENQPLPQVVNQYHNTYNIIIKSEEEADKLMDKIKDSQD